MLECVSLTKKALHRVSPNRRNAKACGEFLAGIPR
jgi:hypothetical protein